MNYNKQISKTLIDNDDNKYNRLSKIFNIRPINVNILQMICNTRNIFAFCINLPKLLIKKRRFLFLILFTFLIACIYIVVQALPQNRDTLTHGGSADESDDDVPSENAAEHNLGENIRLIEFKKLMNDETDETSTYNQEFQEYNSVKMKYKEKTDGNLKAIFPNTRNTDSLKRSKYVILEYTKVFEKTRYCHLFKSSSTFYQDLYINECKYKNCIFSCDKTLTATADALLFHEADLNAQLNNRELMNFINKENIKRTNQDQIWILWNDEANRVNNKLNSINFNWTLSYRIDAEVSDCAYGCKFKKAKSTQQTASSVQNDVKTPSMILIDKLVGAEIAKVLPTTATTTLPTEFHENSKEFEKFIHELKINFIARKNRAVWFVSNCESNYRINIANELRKYYTVIVRGTCETYVQYKNYFNIKTNSQIGKYLSSIYDYFTNKPTKYCQKGSICEVHLLTENKFYLSFESKNCTSYITEKFWSILRIGLIPVVLQPSKQFYEQIAPLDSFIHAQDFNYDMKELAKYLKAVSSDFQLYKQHLLWRYNYNVVHSAKKCDSRRLCELCTRLNEETSTIYYEKIANWFNDQCVIN